MWPTLMNVRTWQLVLVAAVSVSTMFLTINARTGDLDREE